MSINIISISIELRELKRHWTIWRSVRNFVIEGVARQPPSSLRRLQATPLLQTSLEISDSNKPLLDDEGRNDQDQLVTRRRMKGSYDSIVVEI